MQGISYEIVFWLPVILAIWLVPLVVYLFESGYLRRLFMSLMARFGKQPVPTRLLVLAFLGAAILHGGTKPSHTRTEHNTVLPASSRAASMDLFMSTNLFVRSWVKLNDFWMPEETV